MAITLTVYSVPWEKLREIPGSRRRKLVAAIERNYGPRQSLDEMFGDVESPWTLGEAVRQIVNGANLDPGWGTVYAYAVEAICWSLGTMFEGRFSMREREAMDRFLKPLGCPVTLWDLGSRGSPLPIPEPGNPPSVGHWTPEEVLQAGPFFEELSLEGADQRILRGVKEINRWLEDDSNKKPHSSPSPSHSCSDPSRRQKVIRGACCGPLKAKSSEAQESVAEALGKLDDPRAVAPLLDALGELKNGFAKCAMVE